jgi:hypothetical protein
MNPKEADIAAFPAPPEQELKRPPELFRVHGRTFLPGKKIPLTSRLADAKS